MTTNTEKLVTKLGNLGTLTTVVQTFDDDDEVHVYQTLTLNNSNETSVIEITNSHQEHPLLGGDPDDLSQMETLLNFLTSFE